MFNEITRLFRSGNFAETLRKINEFGRSSELSEDVLLMRGISLLRLGQTDEALNSFTLVLNRNPNNAEAKSLKSAASCAINRVQLLAGDTHFQKAEYEEARKCYCLINLDLAVPEDKELQFQLYNNRGACRLQLGESSEALEDIMVALQVRPKNTSALHNKGLAQRSLGMLEDAISSFELSLKFNPNQYETMCCKADCQNALERFSEASLTATDAIGVNPERFTAFAVRGFSKFKQNKLSDAITDIEMALTKGDVSADTQRLHISALTRHADELVRSGSAAEALVVYDQILHLHTCLPSSSNNNTNSGGGGGVIGSSAASLGLGNIANIHFNRAVALLDLGRRKDAVQGFRNVVSADASHSQGQAALGLLLLQEREINETPEGSVNDATSNTTTDDEAVRALTAAHTLMPYDLNVSYNLGVALAQLNQLAQAANQFRAVLVIDPSHASSKTALQLCESELNRNTNPNTNNSTMAAGSRISRQFNTTTTTTSTTRGLANSSAASSPSTRSIVDTDSPKNTNGTTPELTATPATTSLPATKSAASLISFHMVIPYAQLKAPGPYPMGVDPIQREVYLSDEEFESLFGMSREDFNDEPRWKRVEKKKKLHLF